MKTTCPGATALADYAIGRLSTSTADQVEAHLMTCPECLAALSSIEPQDQLLLAVRDGATRVIEETTVSDQVRRLRDLLDTQSSQSAETVTLPPPSKAVDWIGPYRILGILSTGGMGTVYRAEDPILRRQLALKVMKPEIAAIPGAADRFLREARAAATVRHDHIVTIYQVGNADGTPFIAMELLHGEPLDARLAWEGKLSPEEVLHIGRQAALGLAAAHTAGLVHRDIKPANLWLEAPDGRLKILDFGLVRETAQGELTTLGGVVGTPAFMAPEQARVGSPVDHRADLFALGCVLYKAVTGRLPFRGSDAVSLLVAAATETPVPPAQRIPGIPKGLSDLIVQLLDKDVDRRPKSADDVVKMIDEILFQLKKPSRWQRVRKPALLGMIMATVALLAGVVIVRDRQGKEVARVEVPDGGTVTVTPNLPAAPVAEAKSPELLDLEAWMKGRKAITVAQDGSGQFKTIQEALNVVSPGEFVHVLDNGTYRERLTIIGAKNVGLVSTKSATIELPPAPKDAHAWWQRIINVDGFRLHGFRVHFPMDEEYIGLRIQEASGVVIENCWVSCVSQNPSKNRLYAGIGIETDPKQVSLNPVIVRGCRFDMALCLEMHHPDSSSIVEKNWFAGRHEGSHLILRFRGHGKHVVSHNVYSGDVRQGSIDVIGIIDPQVQFHVVNNTIATRVPIKFSFEMKSKSVVLRHNLHSRTYLSCFSAIAPEFVKLTADWQIGPNAYAHRATRVQGWDHVVYDIPPGKGDIVDRVTFLSEDPAHPDYLRLPGDSVHAKNVSGADHFGAFPAGPAPKSGDWFTRLRKQWGQSVK